jgi:hypothetical protein
VIEGHRVILRETDQSHSSEGINAMTTAHDIDLPSELAERLTTCHPDVLRELLATFIHTLMGAPCAVPDTASAAASGRTNATGLRRKHSSAATPAAGCRYGIGIYGVALPRKSPPIADESMTKDE